MRERWRASSPAPTALAASYSLAQSRLITMTENNASNENNEEKGTVLIADDSKIVRTSAKKMLATQFNLVFAEDGEEAWLKLCENQSIQAVFTDLRMPNLDGYGLIKRIRQADDENIRQLPVIVITSSGENEGVKQEVLALGASDFISKPFKAPELIARADTHSRYRRDRAKLEENTELDALTNTLNSAGVAKRLAKDISFVNRHGERLSLVLFEIDHVEQLYADIGKRPMDMIVKQVAATLTRSVRKEDSVGRIAAGRFLAILPMAKAEGVTLLAKRICGAVKAGKIKINQQTLQITMTAGIAAASPTSDASAEQLMCLANEALQQAKNLEGEKVQLLTLNSEAQQEASIAISIDQLLTSISSAQAEIDINQLNAAIARLQPLIALLSEEQKQQLIAP